MIELAPSIMCADLLHVGASLARLDREGLRWLHVDIMDGIFAPGFTFGSDFVRQLRGAWPHSIDVHLMSDRPLDHLGQFLDTEVDLISVHVERPEAARSCVKAISAAGINPGLALAPGSSLEGWDDVIPELGAVLVMGVAPGSVGSRMAPASPAKVQDVRKLLDSNDCEHTPIIFDGGVSVQTIGELARAGAGRFVSGSAMFHAPDLENAINALREACENSAGEPAQ